MKKNEDFMEKLRKYKLLKNQSLESHPNPLSFTHQYNNLSYNNNKKLDYFSSNRRKPYSFHEFSSNSDRSSYKYEEKSLSNLKYPINSSKIHDKSQKTMRNSLSNSNNIYKNQEIFDYPSPLRDFASEILENHQEIFDKNPNKSIYFAFRNRNFKIYEPKYEDFYLKRERKYLNKYNNKYIRDHINEILDHKGYLPYISKSKLIVYKEKNIEEELNEIL